MQNSLCIQVLHSPVLAASLHGTRAVGISQTVAFGRGCHLYSAGRPSRWASAHVLVLLYVSALRREAEQLLACEKVYFTLFEGKLMEGVDCCNYTVRFSFSNVVPQLESLQKTRPVESMCGGLVEFLIVINCASPHHHNHFTALFPGCAGARRELLDFMVQGKIDRGRHTNHPAGRHSIRTNQCPPPPSPHFLQAGCPSCHPTNSVKALKD